MIYNIFYDSNKDIAWCSGGAVTDQIITDQAALGLTHVALDLAQIPECDKYYINSKKSSIPEDLSSYNDEIEIIEFSNLQFLH